MYQINYRAIAVVVLSLFGIMLFYKDPEWVVELLYPDHFKDNVKPRDSLIFVLCVLVVIFGTVLVLIRRGPRK